MTKIIKFILLIVLSIFYTSSSCDHGPRGCTDYSACNFDSLAIDDDGSCQYAQENYDCVGNCLLEIDCAGICGGISTTDCCGSCDADSSNNPSQLNDGNCLSEVVCGCIKSNKCNYNQLATHSNDSCAIDLSEYGGSIEGYDCDGICNGDAVEDPCGFCVGGKSSIFGKSWLIDINATVILSDSSRLYDSAHIGASIYADDSYNNIDISESNCDGCYIDFPEGCGLTDSLCFYFPRDDWEGLVDTIFTNGYDFDKDIRKNDLINLFSNGLDWNAEITSIVSENVLIDSLILDFIFDDKIESAKIKVKMDYSEEYEVENQMVRLKIDNDEVISININISNICFSKF